MSSDRKQNDGGPAFPVNLPGWGDNGASGMTLRDAFALGALPAVITQYAGDNGWIGTDHLLRNVPIHAYRIADAMLKAREAKND